MTPPDSKFPSGIALTMSPCSLAFGMVNLCPSASWSFGWLLTKTTGGVNVILWFGATSLGFEQWSAHLGYIKKAILLWFRLLFWGDYFCFEFYLFGDSSWFFREKTVVTEGVLQHEKDVLFFNLRLNSKTYPLLGAARQPFQGVSAKVRSTNEGIPQKMRWLWGEIHPKWTEDIQVVGKL